VREEKWEKLDAVWLGENCCAGNPQQQFAIAGPEMG
jgi:hypothetical protein